VPRCKKCGEKYDEDEGAASPVETLGEIFLESAGEEPDNLCPGAGRRSGCWVCWALASSRSVRFLLPRRERVRVRVTIMEGNA
jgi:hypothetical protein